MSVSRKPVRIAALDGIPKAWRGAVVAIGNFDGVHRGHQAVLGAALAEAERRGAACIMLTFEPHPRAFFSARPLFRLTPLPLKAALAAALGLDGTLVLTFDGGLADWSAEAFVQRILVERLGISAAVTGHDFHFGKGRSGTPEFLREQGARHGFTVAIVGALNDGAAAVSSTRIRAALADGDLESANAMLGWTWSIVGTVVHGEARGRQLGYPTANMALDPATALAHGVYAVRLVRSDVRLHAGVASFGRRPTFDDGDALLEAHVFDFSGDLYGETAMVRFVGFIRPELKFESAQALVEQMDRDAAQARQLLAVSPGSPLDARVQLTWRAEPS